MIEVLSVEMFCTSLVNLWGLLESFTEKVHMKFDKPASFFSTSSFKQFSR